MSAVAELLRAGADDADMEFAQLLRRRLGRRPHHQIFGALIHREQHHFAQVLLPAQQHDDAVDPGRDSAVRRRSQRKRMEAEYGAALAALCDAPIAKLAAE